MNIKIPIYLLCISHKTAPLEVREQFALSEEAQKKFLLSLQREQAVQEAVVLCTCNRTEIYCSGSKESLVWARVQEAFMAAEGVGETDLRKYMLRFQGEQAVRHLFLVAAGLDSQVLGEDQILGQVRQAYFQSDAMGLCKKNFHSLFRMAITGAKKVKTDTMLSKTSVSTASLALQRAARELGTLQGKKLLLIGASGRIGTILLKDALDREGLAVYITAREHLPHGVGGRQYTVVPYSERYRWMDEMDVVISATSSPHYTVTGEELRCWLHADKLRVFFDLAVPSDIGRDVAGLRGVVCYSMEDMEEIARQNNERKQSYAADAREILQSCQDECLKNMLYSNNIEEINRLYQGFEKEAQEKSPKKAWKHFFYGLKGAGTAEEFAVLLKVMGAYKEFQKE